MRITIIALLLLPIGLYAQITVAVSLQPQAWFVERIAGDRVQTVVMIPPGSSPHSYEPRPAQMAALSDAALYFAVGVEFEKAWLDRFSSANRQMRVVHTDRLIQKIEGDGHHHHHHDDDHHHHHHHHEGFMDRIRAFFSAPQTHHTVSLDNHIWTSPQLALLQARAMAQALAEHDPKGAEDYWSGYARLAKEIARIDSAIAQMLAPYQGSAFLVHHPAWGYFAQDYGLKQVSVEVDGKEPKPAQLQALIAQSRELGIRTVFVQPQFSKRSAQSVAEAIDGEVRVLDPLSAQWGENLMHTAQKIQKALSGTGY